MKRKQEERIMLSALERYGIKITPKLEKNVQDGLREIRRTKYEERMAVKQWKNITRSH